MQEYQKNKGFLPQSYLEEISVKKEKNDNRNIVILLLLNVIFMPLVFSSLRKNNDKDVLVIKNEIQEKGIEKSDIVKWINIIDDKVDSMEISNGTGIIIVNEKNKIFDIEKSSDFEIVSMIRNDDNKYVLRINKEE